MVTKIVFWYWVGITSSEVHIKHWVQAKEGGNVEFKSVVTHSLSDGVRSIMEWTKLFVGPNKELFLQVKPNFVSHLKLVSHPVLIMALLVHGIGHL
jgi:hypothetical protein